MPQNRLFFILKNTREKCDEMEVEVEAVKPIFVEIINVVARIMDLTFLLLKIKIFYV